MRVAGQGASMALQGLCVMVVEDHGFQRRMALRLLADLGLTRVHEAANGHAALEQLESLQPVADIVIVDLDLPGMDGVEFIGHLADRRLAHSIVVASAMDSALIGTVELIAQSSGLQVLGSVEKPLSAGKLAAVLSNFHAVAAGGASPAEALVSVDMLREAIDAEAFQPWFQPQAELRNGKIVAVEMLARWPQQDGGMIEPLRFIPLLEQHGLIDAFTEQMLARSCRHREAWVRDGLDLKLAVNISALCLGDAATADRLEAIVRGEGVDPASVVLEITEGSVICGSPTSLSVLARLRLKGFGLSIDDFGTGYASLSRLSHVPFTELKIDRGFVTGAPGVARKKAVIEASIDLARKLDLRIVGEGVETAEEWELLARCGCGLAQGYLIGRPVPASELPSVVADWRRPGA